MNKILVVVNAVIITIAILFTALMGGYFLARYNIEQRSYVASVRVTCTQQNEKMGNNPLPLKEDKLYLVDRGGNFKAGLGFTIYTIYFYSPTEIQKFLKKLFASTANGSCQGVTIDRLDKGLNDKINNFYNNNSYSPVSKERTEEGQ